MDAQWFKAQQKKAGVTAEDIADRMGRVRSTVSHIYSGRQRMSLEWAKVFAEMLDVPLSEVLERAGVAEESQARSLQPGMAESDAAPFVIEGPAERNVSTIAELFGARPGIDIWRVKSASMSLQGLLPGDYMLVDTHAADRVRAGDVVVAQVYDNNKGTATTLLRRLEPPVLVAASANPDEWRVHVVDGVNVVVRGKVGASWRI